MAVAGVEMNQSTLMHLVRSISTDLGLPFQLVSVIASDGQWEIVVKNTKTGRQCQFLVYDGPPPAMRRAIIDRLEALVRT